MRRLKVNTILSAYTWHNKSAFFVDRVSEWVSLLCKCPCERRLLRRWELESMQLLKKRRYSLRRLCLLAWLGSAQHCWLAAYTSTRPRTQHNSTHAKKGWISSCGSEKWEDDDDDGDDDGREVSCNHHLSACDWHSQVEEVQPPSAWKERDNNNNNYITKHFILFEKKERKVSESMFALNNPPTWEVRKGQRAIK